MLCKICREKLLSLTILRLQFRIFGHTLRPQNETPAAKTMSFYQESSKAEGFRGSLRETIIARCLKILSKRTLAATPNFESSRKLVSYPKIEILLMLFP